MSFIASSSAWGDQVAARMCQIILEANDGMSQQVAENRTDLLDLHTKEELERVDDLGLTLPFLAIYYDQPDILRYLHKRGLDLSQPCDSMDYGNAMFYAVAFQRPRLVETLYKLGYSTTKSCEGFFNQPPVSYAMRYDDSSTISLLKSIESREEKAKEMLQKNVLCKKYSREYLKMRRAIVRIQKIVRGFVGRRFARALRNGEVTLMSSSVYSTEEESTFEEQSVQSSQVS